MASSLTKYLMVTNFCKNPRGSGFFCVEMTWNDPDARLMEMIMTEYEVGG